MLRNDENDYVYFCEFFFIELQDTVAKMFKKEAALFVPSGTMGNLVSGKYLSMRTTC